MKILVFGGTTEGRALSDFLLQMGAFVTLSVATDYGKCLITPQKNLEISAKRMTEQEMKEYLKCNSFDCVADTTHPYADIVSKNIRAACTSTKTKYVRLIREQASNGQLLKEQSLTCVSSAEQAAELLKDKKDKVFLTIGSKELEPFTRLINYSARCYIRIIPMMDSLKKAIDLGFSNANIICMQGPFNIEINQAMFSHAKAKYIVTKNSGDIGGFDAKVTAALNLGSEVIVITRPDVEEGYNWKELLDFFRSLLI